VRIRILESALEDLDRGRIFYEKQAKGLGVYFLDGLFAEIDSLILYAGIHRQVHGYFRCIAKRFPYAIYYKMQDEAVIVVWRILDLRQSPAKIRSKLEQQIGEQ